MVSLYWNPSKVPRTLTREQWKECYRWVRITRKRLREELQKQQQFLATYGTTMPQIIKNDILDKMVNPPLLLGPYMEGL